MADVGSSSNDQPWPRVGDPDWIPLQDTLDPVDLAQSKDYIQHWTPIVRRIRRETAGDPIQAESGGINWYGVDFTNPVEFDVAAGYELAQVVFTLTYTTNASSSWAIPDFCISGPCQSQD
jgi:hypothetical protein